MMMIIITTVVAPIVTPNESGAPAQRLLLPCERQGLEGFDAFDHRVAQRALRQQLHLQQWERWGRWEQ